MRRLFSEWLRRLIYSLSSQFTSRVEDVDLAEPRRRTAVTDGVYLSRLTFSVKEAATKFVELAAAYAVARIPEIRSSRLIGDIAQHLTFLAVLDFPEGLA